MTSIFTVDNRTNNYENSIKELEALCWLLAGFVYNNQIDIDHIIYIGINAIFK